MPRVISMFQRLIQRCREGTMFQHAGRWPYMVVLICVGWMQIRFFLRSTISPVLHRDEANDYFTAMQSWPDLIHHFVTDWVPYTYLLALRAWAGLFGSGEVTLRSLSLVCVLAADIFIYRAVAAWWNNRLAAITAVVIIGLSPVVVLYPFIDFARPYAMGLMLAAFVFERFVVLIQRQSKWNWATLSFGLLLLANIQPVNLGFLAALPLMWLALMIREAGVVRRAFRYPFLLGLLIAATALPTFIQAARFHEGQGDNRVGIESGVMNYYLANAVKMGGWVAPWFPKVLGYGADDNLPGLTVGVKSLPVDILILLLVVAFIMIVMVAVTRREQGAWRSIAAVMLAVICVLYIATAALGNARMLVAWKCYSGVAMGIALSLVAVLRHSRALMVLLLLLTFTRMSFSYGYGDGRNGERSGGKNAARYVMEHEQPGDMIVIPNLVLSPTFSFYYAGSSGQIHHPYETGIRVWHASNLWRHIQEPERYHRTIKLVERALAAGQRVWFISGPMDPDRHPVETWEKWYTPEAYTGIRALLDDHYIKVRAVEFRDTEEPFFVTLYAPGSES